MLTYDDLRLLFMREGKVVGAVWPWLEPEMPEVGRVQLLALIEAAGSDFAALHEEVRDSLMATFTAAAKKGRTPSDPSDREREAASPSALRERVLAMRGLAAARAAGRAEAWTAPADETLAISRALCDNPESGITMADATVLYRDLGRLVAPLWISGERETRPDLAYVAVDALDTIAEVVLRQESVFDEAKAQFRSLTLGEMQKVLWQEFYSSMSGTRDVYFAENPQYPLPANPGQRRLEEDKRAQQQADRVTRATAALDQFIRPMLEAVVAYASARNEGLRAQQAEALAAQVEARAAAGFARPEPQRYGVSPRGAEMWVADALRWLGEHDAQLTRETADGGVDVVSQRLAVSVKHYTGSVPVEEVREIFGVAMTTGRSAVLWTSGSLTAAARQFADIAPVAVVKYDVEAGNWNGLNGPGSDLLNTYDV